MIMKPYKAKSINGAQSQVRKLRCQLNECNKLLSQYDAECRLMAKLAADTPQFYNPLVVFEAQHVRDRILALYIS